MSTSHLCCWIMAIVNNVNVVNSNSSILRTYNTIAYIGMNSVSKAVRMCVGYMIKGIGIIDVSIPHVQEICTSEETYFKKLHTLDEVWRGVDEGVRKGG